MRDGESTQRGQFAFLQQPQQWTACKFLRRPELYFIGLPQDCLRGIIRPTSGGDGDGWICSYSQKWAACLLICGFRISRHSSGYATFQGCKLIKLLRMCGWLGPCTEWRTPPATFFRVEMRRRRGRMKLLARIAFRPTRAQTFSKANSSSSRVIFSLGYAASLINLMLCFTNWFNY